MPKGPSFTIPSGDTESNVVGESLLQNIMSLFIYAPDDAAGDAKILVAPSEDSESFYVMNSPAGTEIVIEPGACVPVMINRGIVAMKLETDSAPEGNDDIYFSTFGENVVI